MKEPYLAIYIHNGTLFFSKKIPSENKARDILEIDIDEVMTDNFDDASKKLGTTVFGILRLWHPDLLKAWNDDLDISDNDSEDQPQNDFDIAMHLISKSVSTKTNAYVESIDALLSEQSLRTKAAHEFFTESWPTIRTRLEKFTS